MKRFAILWMMVAATLLVAAQETVDTGTWPTDTVNGQLVYRYTVEKSVGLYRISKNFGCTQEEIIELNPQLKERGLHFEEVIFVPAKSLPATVEPAVIPSPTKEATPVVEPAPAAEATPASTPTPTQETTAVAETTAGIDSSALRLAVLLPLQAGAVERTAMMDRFFDFYEGVLLAINDIQATGKKLDVTVLDIDKGNSRLEQIIADNQLAGMHGILGPAYPTQVSRIASYIAEQHIPTLIPFTDHVDEIANNPYLMQFNAPSEDEAMVMADWLRERKDSVHCVFVEAREADIPESVKQLRTAIRLYNIPYSTVSVRQILSDSIGLVLRDSVENLLLFNTERYSNLSMMMPHVLSSKGDKRVTLMSQYTWQNEKILLDQVYTTEFTTDLPTDLTHYEAMWKQWFATERNSHYPRYDLLGYDLMRQLVAFLDGQEYFGLQSDIHMEKISDNGGWKNSGVKIVRK